MYIRYCFSITIKCISAITPVLLSLKNNTQCIYRIVCKSYHIINYSRKQNNIKECYQLLGWCPLKVTGVPHAESFSNQDGPLTFLSRWVDNRLDHRSLSWFMRTLSVQLRLLLLILQKVGLSLLFGLVIDLISSVHVNLPWLMIRVLLVSFTITF